MRRNALLGIRAAEAYLDVVGASASPTRAAVRDPLAVSLPGRLSVHRRGDQTWVVDSAISANGVRTALGWCRQAVAEPSTILLSIPTSKDLDACLVALDHPAVRVVRVDVAHLTFAPDTTSRRPPSLADLDHDALGPAVLAMGTISFVGEVLDLLDVDMTRLF